MSVTSSIFTCDPMTYFLSSAMVCSRSGSVRQDQQLFRQRVHFDLGLYAPLWIQQQRERPVPGLERLNVVR